MVRVTSLSVFILVLDLFVQNSNAKGMWGTRRKKREEDEVATSFQESQRIASMIETKKGFGSKGHRSSRSATGLDYDTIIQTYLNFAEQYVTSPEFDTYFNSETLSNIVNNIPQSVLSQYPQITSLLEAPELKDPVLLKQTVIEGLKQVRLQSSQIVEFLNDPDLMSKMLEQFPPEVKEVVEALISGDKTAIKRIISTTSYLDAKQKKILLKLVDGDYADLANTVLGDAELLETARQQFLDNPAMIEMLGNASNT